MKIDLIKKRVYLGKEVVGIIETNYTQSTTEVSLRVNTDQLKELKLHQLNDIVFDLVYIDGAIDRVQICNVIAGYDLHGLYAVLKLKEFREKSKIPA